MKIKVTYRRKRPGISMSVTKAGVVSVSASIGTPEAAVLEFINSHRDWIEKALVRRAESVNRRNEFYDKLPLNTAEECAEASRRLNALIPPLIRKYEPLMGVKVAGLSYTRATTRWGSCNVRSHRVNFSAYLLLLPDWCVEHVVVHELAHLLVPNHSAAFYAVMDRFFPRWKEARAETKRISRLEDDEDAL